MRGRALGLGGVTISREEDGRGRGMTIRGDENKRRKMRGKGWVEEGMTIKGERGWEGKGGKGVTIREED